MFVKMSFWNGAKYANLVDLEPCCTMCFGGESASIQPRISPPICVSMALRRAPTLLEFLIHSPASTQSGRLSSARVCFRTVSGDSQPYWNRESPRDQAKPEAIAWAVIRLLASSPKRTFHFFLEGAPLQRGRTLAVPFRKQKFPISIFSYR